MGVVEAVAKVDPRIAEIIESNVRLSNCREVIKRINPAVGEFMESYPKFSNWKQVIARINPIVGEELLGTRHERMKSLKMLNRII